MGLMLRFTCQGLALILVLFALVMDGVTDEVRQESQWTTGRAEDVKVLFGTDEIKNEHQHQGGIFHSGHGRVDTMIGC